MKSRKRNAFFMFPIQSHYWLLSDGDRYALHGTPRSFGVLVFFDQGAAEKFVRTVGYRLPQFQPVKVARQKFLSIVKEHYGRVATSDAGTVAVAKVG